MSDHKPTAEENALRESMGLEVQPDPIPNDRPSSHDRVIDLLRKRKAFGLEKYNSLLQAGNGRDHIADVLDEMADAMVYLQTQKDELALAKRQAWGEGYQAAHGHIWSTLRDRLGDTAWRAARLSLIHAAQYAPENPHPDPYEENR